MHQAGETVKAAVGKDTMNRKTAALLVAASIVVGVGVGFAVQRLNSESAQASDKPTTSSKPSPTEPTVKVSDEPKSSVPLEEVRADRKGPSWSPRDPVGADGKTLKLGHIVPGGVEPVLVGMPITGPQAAQFIVRDREREESCNFGLERPTFYRWVGELAEGFDVQVDSDGYITSIGIRRDGAETAEGISIGSSYGMLKRVYGSKLSKPSVGEYGQSNLAIQDDGNWVGFLFNEPVEDLKDSSRIIFMEVTMGPEAPGLLRDGC